MVRLLDLYVRDRGVSWTVWSDGGADPFVDGVIEVVIDGPSYDAELVAISSAVEELDPRAEMFLADAPPSGWSRASGRLLQRAA